MNHIVYIIPYDSHLSIQETIQSDDGTPISQNNVLFTGQSVATEWQLDVDIKLTAIPTEYTNLLEVSQAGVVSLLFFRTRKHPNHRLDSTRCPGIHGHQVNEIILEF